MILCGSIICPSHFPNVSAWITVIPERYSLPSGCQTSQIAPCAAPRLSRWMENLSATLLTWEVLLSPSLRAVTHLLSDLFPVRGWWWAWLCKRGVELPVMWAAQQRASLENRWLGNSNYRQPTMEKESALYSKAWLHICRRHEWINVRTLSRSNTTL